jgi:hypothetical protein
MTANEQRFLTKQLRHSNCYLEYGSGNSTRLAVENSNILYITSVESDRQFWQMLIESDRKLLKAVEEKRLNPLLVNIGKTAMWDYQAL